MLCGRWAPVRGVLFRQNIGALVMRFTSKVEGPLCRPCIGSTFFRTTLVTLFLGPWGVISHFLTLYILPSNVLMYWRSRSLPDGEGLGPTQLGSRRSRYTIVAAIGALGSLFALVWIAAGIAMIVSPPEDGSRLGAVVFTWVSILLGGLPFGLVTALGIRGRVRATVVSRQTS